MRDVFVDAEPFLEPRYDLSLLTMIPYSMRNVKYFSWLAQGHSILRNYWILRLFFQDPVRKPSD